MAPKNGGPRHQPPDTMSRWYQRWPSVAPSQLPIPTLSPSSRKLQDTIDWSAAAGFRDANPPYPGLRNPQSDSASRGVLIGMLSALGSAMLVILIIGLVYFFRYTSRGRIFLDRIGRPGEFDDEQAFAKEEAEALESMDDIQRAEYMRAKAFIQSNPPESAQTDISLSQFLAIQEKGVSAWEFEPELEIANCFVEGRTEIEFFDSECSVQSNLPVPKQNEVYYWEAKIYDKPETTAVGIGMTTKPYPLFRMPGFHKCSIAYLSPGHRRFNQPFNPVANYGPPFVRGDVVGVGYRPRTGTVFFTRNGKKLEDVTHSLKSQNLFPTVGATGPATVHVNFGQMGFVYIEANVKKWGLAPMTGSLAPPPPYGSEQGSILLEGADRGVPESFGQTSLSPPSGRGWGYGHGRSRSAQVRSNRGQHPTSPGPQRSPTDISLAQLSLVDSQGDLGDDDGSNTALQGASGQSGIDPTRSVSVTQSLSVEDSPPPEYSSPLLQHNEWPGSNPRNGYFDSQNLNTSSQSRSRSHRQARRQKRRRASNQAQQSQAQEPYRDFPDEETFHEPYVDDDGAQVESGEVADESASTPRPSTAVRHSRHSSREVNAEDENPSPPIPTYEVAVGRASTDADPSSDGQGEGGHAR